MILDAKGAYEITRHAVECRKKRPIGPALNNDLHIFRVIYAACEAGRFRAVIDVSDEVYEDDVFDRLKGAGYSVSRYGRGNLIFISWAAVGWVEHLKQILSDVFNRK